MEINLRVLCTLFDANRTGDHETESVEFLSHLHGRKTPIKLIVLTKKEEQWSRIAYVTDLTREWSEGRMAHE